MKGLLTKGYSGFAKRFAFRKRAEPNRYPAPNGREMNFKLKLVVSILCASFFGVVGCKSNNESSATSVPVQDMASVDSNQKRLEDLYERSLKGDVAAIRDFITFEPADGAYGEFIQDGVPELLIKQSKATLQVLKLFSSENRKEIFWNSLASESASPPDNLLVAVAKEKTAYPKICQEIADTLEAGKKYMALYTSKGELAAVEFMKQYLGEK